MAEAKAKDLEDQAVQGKWSKTVDTRSDDDWTFTHDWEIEMMTHDFTISVT